MGIFDSFKAAGMRQVLAYIEKDPDANILKVCDWMIMFNIAGSKHNEDLLKVREHLADQSSSWYRLVRSLWTDIDDRIRKKLFENLVINTGLARQNDDPSSTLPMGIMLDQQGNVMISRLPAARAFGYDEYDHNVRSLKSKGIYAFVFTGGADSISSSDLRRLAKAHDDCVFVTMVRSHDVDDMFADRCYAVMNIVPMVAVYDPEQEMDESISDCIRAMRILKERRLAFGAYCKCRPENCDQIMTDAFADDMAQNGAKLLWIFEEEGSQTDPEKGKELYERVLAHRNTKPLLAVDFMYEEEYLGGRITGI